VEPVQISDMQFNADSLLAEIQHPILIAFDNVFERFHENLISGDSPKSVGGTNHAQVITHMPISGDGVCHPMFHKACDCR
jgi:hypothetical protein